MSEQPTPDDGVTVTIPHAEWAGMPSTGENPPDSGAYCWRCGLQPGNALVQIFGPNGKPEWVHSGCPGAPDHPVTGAPLTPGEVLEHMIPSGASVMPLPGHFATAAAASIPSGTLPTEADRDPLTEALAPGGPSVVSVPGPPLPGAVQGSAYLPPPYPVDLSVDPATLSPGEVATAHPFASAALDAGADIHPNWRIFLTKLEDAVATAFNDFVGASEAVDVAVVSQGNDTEATPDTGDSAAATPPVSLEPAVSGDAPSTNPEYGGFPLNQGVPDAGNPPDAEGGATA